MTTYQVIQEKNWSPEIGYYTAFGIAAAKTQNGAVVETACFSDVFPDRVTAEHFAETCNRLDLDILHLPEAIADALQKDGLDMAVF